MSAVTGQYKAFDQANSNWRTWAYVVAGALAGVVILAASLREVPQHEVAIRGVSWDCHSSACLSPRQLVTGAEARQMKRRLGSHALIVDTRAPGSGAGRFGPGVDARAPFIEKVTPLGPEFRVDFGHRMDEAMRDARMAFDDPVLVTAPSLEHSVLAALFLQERGYSNVLVVTD